MKDSPKYLIDKLTDVTVGYLAISDFEKWLYAQNNLMDQMESNEFYFDLFEFNYIDKGAKYNFRKLILDKLDKNQFRSLEIIKALQLLFQDNVLNRSLLNELHELYRYEDIKFLKSLSYAYYSVEEFEQFKLIVPNELLHFIKTESDYVLENLKKVLDKGEVLMAIDFVTNLPPYCFPYDMYNQPKKKKINKTKKETPLKIWWKKLLNI